MQLIAFERISRIEFEHACSTDIFGHAKHTQATVTNILDRLEKRELVIRERSTVDKRKVHVRLTDRGNGVLIDAPTPLQEQFARQFVDLQEWEQTMIISSLQRVAYMMDAQHIDASPVLDVGILDRAPPEAGVVALGSASTSAKTAGD